MFLRHSESTVLQGSMIRKNVTKEKKNSNLEYSVLDQNNTITIKCLNALAFSTELIQIPRWCLSYSMVNLISIHLAQLVYACICREAVSTIMWVHNVLRGGLVILRLTLLSFFIQEIKINFLPIKEWYEECYFIALMFKVFNKYMFSCVLLIAKW